MNDTNDNIKKLQKQIWLSKTPTQRLEQFMKDNELLLKFWKENKINKQILK